MIKRLQIPPTVCSLTHAGMAALILVMLLALMACGSGGSTTGGGSTTTANSTPCGSAATCLGAFNNVYDPAALTISTAYSAESGSGTGGGAESCISWTDSGTSPDINISMTFNNCSFTDVLDTIIANGSITVAATATTYTITSNGFSVSGNSDGNAVDFSCAMSISINIPTGAITGTICGTSITNVPAAPTDLTASGSCPFRTLNWTQVSGAFDYNMYASNSSGTELSATGINAPKDIGMPPYSGYSPQFSTTYIIVTAFSAVEESAPSNEVTVPGC